MRLWLLSILCLVALASAVQADPWSHKGYVTGKVLTGGNHYAFIDMGYAHRIRPFQQVAVFRSRNRVFHPIGVFRVERVDPTQAVVPQSRDNPARDGDLVVTLERDLIPLDEGGFLEDHYVRTQIINRGTRNGYSTGYGDSVANAFRAQSHEISKRRSKAWEDGFKRITVELPKIETDMQRALIVQLEYFRAEAKTSARSFAPLNREWKQVMIFCEPKLTVNAMAPKLNDQRIFDAASKFMPELDDECSQLIAFLIARGIPNPANQEASIRAAFRNSQFGTLSTDERLPKSIATYIQELAAMTTPDAPMQ